MGTEEEHGTASETVETGISLVSPGSMQWPKRATPSKNPSPGPTLGKLGLDGVRFLQESERDYQGGGGGGGGVTFSAAQQGQAGEGEAGGQQPVPNSHGGGSGGILREEGKGWGEGKGSVSAQLRTPGGGPEREMSEGSQTEASDEEDDDDEGDPEEGHGEHRARDGAEVGAGVDGRSGAGAGAGAGAGVKVGAGSKAEAEAEGEVGAESGADGGEAGLRKPRSQVLVVGSVPLHGRGNSAAEGFHRPVLEEGRSHASLPACQPLGIYLANPASAANPIAYSSSDLSGVQLGARGEATGASFPAARAVRDSESRECVTGSFLERPGSGLLRESQQAVAQGSPRDSLRGSCTDGDSDNYYTSLLTSSGANSHMGKDAKHMNDLPQKSPNVLELQAVEPSLRHVLSDPTTGQLMEDATILSCGHTFGCGGLRQVMQNRACLTCGAATSPETMAPNYSLRAAVAAFKREGDAQKSSAGRLGKRRREQYDQSQDPPSQGDALPSDSAKSKGVQFPFVVSDRVLIKGNKRTPGRFVGREAIITTQCLNGWYLVRTLDNGESVRLQYRSLQKIGDPWTGGDDNEENSS